ncbi:MAG: LysR family transcriptional regulator [Gammaproteobacteria bacterium]|nr:LysR family transcriptional regulator [Gammaproteobacteria bacterium]
MGRRNLPPLNALRAFEAASRLNGFQPAAEELCVTPGAISQQVKRLEEWIGEVLFQRHVRGVSLTPTGAQLQPKLSRLMDQLEEITAAYKTPGRQNRLVINVLPAFAERWLMPRLKHFQKEHSDLEIEVRAEDALPSFSSGEIEVGLRYLDAPIAGLKCERILEEELFPVCAPDCASKLNPEDLHKQALLYDVAWKNDWPLWWQAAGLPGSPPQGTRFSLYNMAVQSAIDGGGIAMGHSALLERELESGVLVEPFDLRVEASGCYYLLWKPARDGEEQVKQFQKWVEAQINS